MRTDLRTDKNNSTYAHMNMPSNGNPAYTAYAQGHMRTVHTVGYYLYKYRNS